MSDRQEDRCPSCGHLLDENQSPDDAGIEDIFYFYEWTCENCGEIFLQWYDLVWKENTVY